MEARTTTVEPTAVERQGSSQELLARLPVKSLSAVLGGLAALGVADSADAMVSDGGFSSKSSKSDGEGSSSSSGSAKQTPARQASPPANSSSDRESGTSYAVSRGAQRSSSSSGSGSSGSSGSGSSGSSASGSSGSGSSRSSGSSGSSGGDPANLRGLRGPSGGSSKGSSGSSRSSRSSGSSSSGSSGSSSSSSYTLDRPAGSREGRSTSDDREATSSRAVSRGAKRASSSSSGSSSGSASSGGSGWGSRSYAPPSRTDASDGYAGMSAGAGVGASGSTGASRSDSQGSSRVPRSSRSSGYSRTGDRPGASGEGRSSSGYSGGSSSDRPSRQASPPPGTERAPGDSPTPVWTGPRWPRAEGSREQDAGRAVKRAQGDADDGVRSKQGSGTPEDNLRRAGRQVGRSAREAVRAVGRAAAKGADTGEAAGRMVRDAADAVPSGTPKGFRRGPGGELHPVPRPHQAKQGSRDTYPGGPRRGEPRADDARRDFSYGENDLQNEWLGTPGVVYGGGPYGNGRMRATPPRRRRSNRVEPDSIPGPPRPGGPFDFGYPEDGPSLVDWPKGPIGLPYQGQEAQGTSCSRSGADPRGCNDFVPNGKPKNSAKLGVEGSVVKTKGQTEVLRGDGSTRSTLSLTTNLRVKGKAEAASRRRFGFGLNGALGRTSSYSVSVDDPDRADAIATGEGKAPNPHDPTSLKVNEGLTISRETYLGAGAEAAYKELRLAVNREAGDRVSSGITRVNKRRVRLDVGDEETVRQGIEAGVQDPTGLFGFSVGGGDEQASGRKRSVTLDFKTRRGWEAHQRFIVTGKLPSPESKAVKRMSNTDDENWKSTIGSKGKAGPFSWDSSDVSRLGNESVTRYRNGKVERSWVDKSYGVGGAMTEATKPNGKAGKSSYAIRLERVPEDAANDFLEARGQKADRDGDQDITVKYSKADLWQLRGEARNLILAESDDGTTIMDVNRDLADGEREEVGGHIGVDTAQDVLAMTKSPEEAIRALSSTDGIDGTSYMGDAEQFLGWLRHHEERVGERDTRPGRAAQVTDSAD